MEGGAGEFHDDWELLQNSEDSGFVNPLESDDKSGEIEGMGSDSEEMFRSDYFSLDSRGRYEKTVALSEGSEYCSNESDNPSWIDPVPEPSHQRRESGGFWSDSGSDRSDERKIGDSELKNELSLVEDDKTKMDFQGLGETEADDLGNELGSANKGENQLDLRRVEEIVAKDIDSVELWSDSGGKELDSVELEGISAKNEVTSGEIDGKSDSSEEVRAENTNSGDDGNAAGEDTKPVGELDKRRVAWWKVPIELMKYCVLRVGPVWSFSVAAAVMGFVILGRKWYKMKRRSRGLEIKVTVDDKVSFYVYMVV